MAARDHVETVPAIVRNMQAPGRYLGVLLFWRATPSGCAGEPGSGSSAVQEGCKAPAERRGEQGQDGSDADMCPAADGLSGPNDGGSLVAPNGHGGRGTDLVPQVFQDAAADLDHIHAPHGREPQFQRERTEVVEPAAAALAYQAGADET